MRLAFAALLTSAALAAPAAAQSGGEPVFQGGHQDWRVFTRGEGDSRVCYATSRPSESLPASVDHGEVYFLVSTWANGAADEQPSFLAGYALRPASPPRVRVGADRFTMFVSEQEGFVEEARDEARLVDAMKRGSSMRVEAMSARGTATAYEFSLSGVTAALQKVEDLCD
ncbi:MAG: invasion associated locus B family protein [Oceanicaulis sp.]